MQENVEYVQKGFAPLYDAGELTFLHAAVSFVEPITKRSRHARQGVLFVELLCKISDRTEL